jgi:hypothetical protein
MVGNMMQTRDGAVKDRCDAALDRLLDDVRRDRSVLAAILCGSLSHDTVWEKSDIDLVLVTVDDKAVPAASIALFADGVDIHALLVPRGEFRKAIEGSLRNSFLHAFLAKGRLLYTHDPTVEALCASLHDLGLRDQRLQLLRAGMSALSPFYKARKWLVTRADLDYTALWILYAATPLARIEVIGRGLLADREVILQATALNPQFFRAIYADLLNAPKTRDSVLAALEAIDHYLAERAPTLFAAVIDHLREVGEARSCTEINAHFQRTLGIPDVVLACEYLADQRLLVRAAAPARLTKKSNVAVQELAFVYVDPAPGGDRGPAAAPARP